MRVTKGMHHRDLQSHYGLMKPSSLPPTITFVGDLEPFRDETVAFVKRLEKSGIPVEFRLFPGCYHAFDVLFPQLSISQQAWSFLLTAFQSYVDLYLPTSPKETL